MRPSSALRYEVADAGSRKDLELKADVPDQKGPSQSLSVPEIATAFLHTLESGSAEYCTVPVLVVGVLVKTLAGTW